MSQQDQAPTSREARFVEHVLTRTQQDKGLAARLRRADNPSTEYQSWDFFADFGIDLENPTQRLPFVTVAAAMARAKASNNGSIQLGQALSDCYPDSTQNEQAKARLRRILACDSVTELCRVLRPVLTLIESRLAQPLDYVRLLQQLRRFTWDPQIIRSQWAQEFYGRGQEPSRQEAA